MTAWTDPDPAAFAWLTIRLYGALFFEFLRHKNMTWAEFVERVNMINDDFDDDGDDPHPLSEFDENHILYEHLSIAEKTVQESRCLEQEMPKTPEAYRAMYQRIAVRAVLPPFVDGEEAYVTDVKPCELCGGAPAEFDAELKRVSITWANVCGPCFAAHGKSYPRLGFGCAQRLIIRPPYVDDPRSEADKAKAKADRAEADQGEAWDSDDSDDSDNDEHVSEEVPYIPVRVFAHGNVQDACAGTLSLF